MKKVHGHVMHSCISVTQCQRWWKFGKDQIVGRSHFSLPPGTSHGMPSAPSTSHQGSSCDLSLLASWTPSLQDENHLYGRQEVSSPICLSGQLCTNQTNYIFIIKAQCHKHESDLRYVNDINHIDLNTVPYIVPAPSITNEWWPETLCVR